MTTWRRSRPTAYRVWPSYRSASSGTTWRSSRTSTRKAPGPPRSCSARSPEPAEPREKRPLPMARAATPGTDEKCVTMLRDLVVERAAAERGEQPDRPCVGKLGPGWDDCRPDCCPALRRPTPQKEAV